MPSYLPNPMSVSYNDNNNWEKSTFSKVSHVKNKMTTKEERRWENVSRILVRKAACCYQAGREFPVGWVNKWGKQIQRSFKQTVLALITMDWKHANSVMCNVMCSLHCLQNCNDFNLFNHIYFTLNHLPQVNTCNCIPYLQSTHLRNMECLFSSTKLFESLGEIIHHASCIWKNRFSRPQLISANLFP